MKENIEIVCPTCGKETLLKKEPVYDGFKKKGELLKCISCGHIFDDKTKVPFKDKKETPAIFNKEDLPKAPQVFKGDENARLCRYCKHYIVNPFTQRCAFHHKEVEATDTCENFEKKE